MSSKLEKFIKSKVVKKSILDTQKDEIFELKRLEHSFETICQYLATVGIKTTKQNLCSWFARRNKNTKSATHKVVDSVQDIPITKPNLPSQQAQAEEVNDDAIAKFMKFATKKHSVDELVNLGKKNS